MRIQLKDLAPGQTYGLQFRSTDGINLSDWSQVERFTTTSDIMPPANVTGLSFYDSGSSYIATWNKVTTNGDGSPLLDFRRYHIHVHTVSGDADFYTTGENFELTRQANLALLNGVTLVTISVTAQDNNYNESTIAATASLDPSTPPTPSTPTITNLVGLMNVVWDGKNSGGVTMATNVVYLEVHVSTTSGFTPSPTTYTGSLTAQSPSYVVPGLSYDTTYYVKLVAVNVFNKKSSASGQASGGPQRISGLDIANGQISANQINFTAKDIGGANAYYPATTTARDALTGVKSGDLAYITGSGYAVYRYNGTTWVSAPEVGLISGTKILTGTLTSDAVGTNLLITASANIASAIIDDAKISSVSAAKLTAGTVTSNIVVSGRLATALTGARVEINSTGIQQYASDGVTKLVDISPTGSTFTGVLQTSNSGRRVYISGNSSVGQISILSPTYTGVSPNNVFAFLLGETEADGTTEAIQFGISNATLWPTGGFLWNRINYNSTGWANYQAVKHDFTYASTGDFIVRQTSDFNHAPTQVTKFLTDSSGTYLLDGAGNTLIQINASSGLLTFWGRAPYKSGVGTAGIGGFVNIAAANDPNVGNVFQMYTAPVSGANYGAMLYYGQDGTTPSPTNPRFAFQFWDASAYIPLWASDFHVPSDAAIKEEIEDFSASALDIVNGLKVREYYRKPPTGVGRSKKKEVGLVFQETHPALAVENSTDKGVSLYSVTSVTIKSVQELHAYAKTLETRIQQLEKGK